MRAVSLLILLLVLGGAAFVFIHDPTRNWVFKKGEEGVFLAEGYNYAKTPREAMELFEKAVKARNFKAAARYCSDDYAKVLVKGHDAGKAIGQQLDKIYDLLHGKQMRTPMAVKLLFGMDPFPNTIKLEGEVKETKKGEAAEGLVLVVPLKMDKGNDLSENQISKIDRNLFGAYPLMPANFGRVLITMDKKSDSWKINFTPKNDMCDYFIDHYKRYDVGYTQFADDLRRDTFLADAVGPGLLDVLIKSNPK